MVDYAIDFIDNLFDAEHFSEPDVTAWMIRHFEVPIFATAIYLVMVFKGQEYMKDRPAFQVKWLFILWNFILSVFSICGAVMSVRIFMGYLEEPDGWFNTVCRSPRDHPRGFYHPNKNAFWAFAFSLAKIPEMLDTLFLVVQKKPIIFLHWYHHVTVMLFCWQGLIIDVLPCLYFMTMNFIVHGVMYPYYFFMSLSPITRAMVKPIALPLTALQIMQMIAGCGTMLIAIYWHFTGRNCPINHANTQLALVMYGSYFYLFAQLFANRHVKGAAKK